ncbi:F0F1 ATP synthase subunit B [Gemmatimonas sp.]|jgi:F-type H+-transporting ATPase subunit b|uniref:F0F1 ATP synthase subunit B n=1 Tax=Gemmatimonas sp. TaxID=1962908 RepID=UPI0022BA8DC9|nr:F0F1 ATP synthase subunit B [Gemmatimonas sp.]MCA2985492.1 F0F1 ATP synthase subunit B [Gemmatimonas sp.]MCA2988507.1 F0F1 ATP synthase subunit B [Gemmatimonas sp.]MCA2991925.1 F0F1 ATP synthase subunit B [Gemmatimonas sp.]MCA2995765.1 F0F1 ATP synthase subunit B [Gemmatimonas sp.]MCE2953157.1 F0F1 ATP synthase subunit B [Gemmatimonas sp.]
MFALSARRVGALAAALMISATPALASESAEGGPPNLLDPNVGVMAWTLIIFVLLLFVLSKFAFKPLFAAVEAREKALEDAIEGAKRDRAATEDALAQQRAQLEAARSEAQQIIADSRATAEKMRADLLAQTKQQQEEMIEQARRTIEGEKAAAIADLRKEAVDLAIAGASRVIEQNLDSAGNRKIVESFLASLDQQAAR